MLRCLNRLASQDVVERLPGQGVGKTQVRAVPRPLTEGPGLVVHHPADKSRSDHEDMSTFMTPKVRHDMIRQRPVNLERFVATGREKLGMIAT
jgi:hypothetical protein